MMRPMSELVSDGESLALWHASVDDRDDMRRLGDLPAFQTSRPRRRVAGFRAGYIAPDTSTMVGLRSCGARPSAINEADQSGGIFHRPCVAKGGIADAILVLGF